MITSTATTFDADWIVPQQRFDQQVFALRACQPHSSLFSKSFGPTRFLGIHR